MDRKFRILRFSRTRSAGSHRTNSELASRVDFGTSLSRWSRRLPLRILNAKLSKGVAFLFQLDSLASIGSWFTFESKRNAPTGPATENEVANPVGFMHFYSFHLYFVYSVRLPLMEVSIFSPWPGNYRRLRGAHRLPKVQRSGALQILPGPSSHWPAICGWQFLYRHGALPAGSFSWNG